MKRICVEVGSDHLRRHWREIHRRLSRRQALLGQQYGGVWLGGLIVQDPCPAPGRGQSQRFFRFAVEDDTHRRAVELRNRLPAFRTNDLATLALPWLQELDTQRRLQLQDSRIILRDFERDLVDKYSGCKIYAIYHNTLKEWLKVRFETYINRVL
ncbi:hypothetical protein MIR68_006548 [Amoeboaphelidium protococcarum]|nr:hypothetical protein MIR68_006548 [Amoeboaphelidium protococcarum]